jgi:hypothetical protein
MMIQSAHRRVPEASITVPRRFEITDVTPLHRLALGRVDPTHDVGRSATVPTTKGWRQTCLRRRPS